MSRPAALTALFLLAFLGSCGSDAELASARGLVRAGRLDRAEAVLVGVTCPEAVALRAEIAGCRTRREEVEAAVSTLLAADGDPISGLRALLTGEDDPVIRDRVERALSKAADRPRKPRRDAASGDDSPPPPVLADARRALDAGEWSRALSLLKGATSSGATDARVEQLTRDLEVLARNDAARVVREADSLAQSVGAGVARDYLLRAAERFPQGAARQVVDQHGGRLAAQADREQEPENEEAQVAGGPDAREESGVESGRGALAATSLVSNGRVAARAQSPAHERLADKLAVATASERDALYEELAAVALKRESARTALARALEERWARATRTLTRSSILRRLAGLAKTRTELDEARRLALELIFDEERYFYPYRAPEVSEDRSRAYLIVQEEVDELVSRVHALWSTRSRVPLSSSFRRAARDVEWLLSRDELAGAELDVPDGAPAWITGLDGRHPALDIKTFAWSFAEAEALRKASAILAYNARTWDALEESAAPSAAERESVRLTNAYRAMFGVEPLGWNPRIYAAARSHSEYMGRTEDFGHGEPEPDRRTPRDRMLLFGYARGTGENVHLGRIPAQGVHNAWTRSSAHHRALLLRTDREVASAVVGDYWTQNFGTDIAFLKELEEWRD